MLGHRRAYIDAADGLETRAQASPPARGTASGWACDGPPSRRPSFLTDRPETTSQWFHFYLKRSRRMSRTLTVRAETWPLKGAFAISRGSKTASKVVVAEIIDGDFVGRGECVPYPHYGESVAGVATAIEAQAAAVAGGLDRIGLLDKLAPGAARNALDCALWDLEANAAGQRAWELAGLAPPSPVITAETLGIDSAEAMGAAAAALGQPGLVKISSAEMACWNGSAPCITRFRMRA